MNTTSRSRFSQSRKGLARARRQSRREPSDRILVVCEGAKTEPNYFDRLRISLDINKHRVKITGGGSSPLSVVNFAHNYYLESKKTDDQIDRVFCVFDKNDHQDYDRALAKIKSIKPRGAFQSINSVPAFEYFLILHYEYTTRLLTSAEALARLKRHMPGYQKGDKNIFSVVRGRLETAKGNAVQSLAEANMNNTDNPTTKAHELVEFMENIKRLPPILNV